MRRWLCPEPYRHDWFGIRRFRVTKQLAKPLADGVVVMDFWSYTTNREACSKAGVADNSDEFYKLAFAEAIALTSSQFFNQLNTERDWEQARKPYYNVWPSIVPMLTRLDLDLDSALIQLPMPALSIRLPKQQNPMTFEWQDQPFEVRCMLLAEINEGRACPS